MAKANTQPSRDYRDFRFRLRHDLLLRRRLRRAKQEATISLARELGFNLTFEDLQGNKRDKHTKPASQPPST